MTELRLREQIEAMRTDWPALKVRRLDRTQGVVRWVGELRPQYTRYTIDIRYSPQFQFPFVRVLVPVLLRQPCNGEGALPHVYPPADDPVLCLFDPRGGEWGHSMLISRTTVPWTLDWLTCYEFWAMTGNWVGGGRHAGLFEPPINTEAKP
jgi:hypothetical protein